MESRRQLKVSSVMQQAFSEILIREGKALFGKAFVTLTKVKLTSDLGLARFYLSIYNTENPDEVIDKFNEHKGELKRKLTEKLRNQLRMMPEIEFFRDETLDYAFHIDDVFKKIKEEDEKIAADRNKPAKTIARNVAAKKVAAKKPKIRKAK